jgi:hypothetical protein
VLGQGRLRLEVIDRGFAGEALRVHRFAYDVNAYFQAFKDDAHPEHSSATPAATAIYRQGFTLWRMSLRPAMATLLEELMSGAALEAALDRMSACLDGADLAEAERGVSVWLRSFVSSGFFREIVVPPTPSATGVLVQR